MASVANIVEATGIVRHYGTRRALDGFSIEVPQGGVFGLLGPNGSGKSTFISMLAAMERPSEGSLRVFGQEPSAGLRARTGSVFQENAQDPLMSVRETIALAGRLFGLSAATIAQRTATLLDQFGLAGRSGDAVASLSGGMRRRLEMVRALLHDPELLVLDEPTTGVDADERQALWAGLRGSGARTILLATNDLAEADSVCDRVAFIKDGRIVVSGTPGELKRGLRHEVLRMTWSEPPAGALDRIAGMPGVGEVTDADGIVHITTDNASALVPALFEIAPHAIRAVSIDAATLEDAYFQHVGRRAQPAVGATIEAGG
jgi:ABC-2 type transport system ATP-binding protein